MKGIDDFDPDEILVNGDINLENKQLYDGGFAELLNFIEENIKDIKGFNLKKCKLTKDQLITLFAVVPINNDIVKIELETAEIDFEMAQTISNFQKLQALTLITGNISFEAIDIATDKVANVSMPVAGRVPNKAEAAKLTFAFDLMSEKKKNPDRKLNENNVDNLIARMVGLGDKEYIEAYHPTQLL